MPGERGPMPAALRPLAPLAERVYARIVRDRNASFDAGKRAKPFSFSGLSVTLDRPVICVGNLSVGGTGKTPAVQMVCNWLIEAGHHPTIALRGYASNNGLSDEAELHRTALPDVPLAVGPNRVQQLLQLFATPEGENVDVVVLDDGFQHRRLVRQLDIVLIDATQDAFAQRLLPAGWLREPVSSLARAQAVVLTHADRATPSDLSRIEAELRRQFPHLVVAHAEHAWSELLVMDRVEPLDWLRGRRYALACAIGKPQAFIDQAAAAFGPPAHTIELRDHDPYAPATIERLRRAADGMDALLVTEKDWTKLARIEPDAWSCPIVRPRLQMRLSTGVSQMRTLVLSAATWQDDASAAG
ncbi:MAG: tetraacyldisaccharide 4'-kinase [Phycisphaera sp.]|nr:MAG: tetraacyldisaccharide 4'-kinase [Phycisphaera sp.]